MLAAGCASPRVGQSSTVSPRHRKRPAEIVSRNMAAVRARDSKAEMMLRSQLWRRGHRFRVCRRDLPGKPDLVFARAQVCVFVDGDFWHARVLVERGVNALRASFHTARVDWWLAKLSRNAARDREITEVLRREGWAVVRVWERDVLRDPGGAVATVEKVIRMNDASRS